jgi:hypothetical protein
MDPDISIVIALYVCLGLYPAGAAVSKQGVSQVSPVTDSFFNKKTVQAGPAGSTNCSSQVTQVTDLVSQRKCKAQCPLILSRYLPTHAR